MTHEDIVREVQLFVTQAMAQGPVATARLQEEIVRSHQYGGDVSWSIGCAYDATRLAIREVMRRIKGDADSQNERQTEITMPGFERLQVAYLVQRDGESFIVSIHSMTLREVRAKARDYRRMATGCLIHSNELDRWGDEMEANSQPTIQPQA